MKKKFTSLKMVLVYAGILLVIIITTTTRPAHISDRPQPTDSERLEQAAADSLKFRTIRRAQAGDSDYTIPDSAARN